VARAGGTARRGRLALLLLVFACPHASAWAPACVRSAVQRAAAGCR